MSFKLGSHGLLHERGGLLHASALSSVRSGRILLLFQAVIAEKFYELYCSW
eukprot:SAG31_NODE_5559_length_2458_cov_3.930479_3_plen_51_part_00